jgi:hypothetical protein
MIQVVRASLIVTHPSTIVCTYTFFRRFERGRGEMQAACSRHYGHGGSLQRSSSAQRQLPSLPPTVRQEGV